MDISDEHWVEVGGGIGGMAATVVVAVYLLVWDMNKVELE